MMSDIATLDTGFFQYQDHSYAETASIGNDLGATDDILAVSLIQKRLLQHTDISAWNKQEDEEADLKLLEDKIEQEKVRTSIKERIYTLKRLGLDEAVTPSEKSAQFLIDFFNKRMIKNEPLIFLLENGNYRALWEGENGQQIGLQFLPDKNIQFVIFASRPDQEGLARSYGSDTPEGINRQVEINKLRSLFYS